TTRREELREYRKKHGEPFRADSSNDSLEVPRNRVRHRLLPVIEDIAPGGLKALARFAALSADDDEYLEAAARAAIAIERNPGTAMAVQLDADHLGDLPT